MNITLDLNTIKRQSQLLAIENTRFRTYLKGQSSEEIDRIVHELYEKVIEKVDCTECANCCIKLETSFRMDEIDRLAQALNIDKEEFISNSTKPDPYGDPNIRFLNSTPCQFLKDKKCTIYDLRPKECNSYPYLHKTSIISRLLGLIENYAICPIVYNVFEQLKLKLDYKNR
jgi:Fe-S-cluster containining protein